MKFLILNLFWISSLLISCEYNAEGFKESFEERLELCKTKKDACACNSVIKESIYLWKNLCTNGRMLTSNKFISSERVSPCKMIEEAVNMRMLKKNSDSEQ